MYDVHFPVIVPDEASCSDKNLLVKKKRGGGEVDKERKKDTRSAFCLFTEREGERERERHRERERERRRDLLLLRLTAKEAEWTD